MAVSGSAENVRASWTGSGCSVLGTGTISGLCHQRALIDSSEGRGIGGHKRSSVRLGGDAIGEGPTVCHRASTASAVGPQRSSATSLPDADQTTLGHIEESCSGLVRRHDDVDEDDRARSSFDRRIGADVYRMHLSCPVDNDTLGPAYGWGLG